MPGLRCLYLHLHLRESEVEVALRVGDDRLAVLQERFVVDGELHVADRYGGVGVEYPTRELTGLAAYEVDVGIVAPMIIECQYDCR